MKNTFCLSLFILAASVGVSNPTFAKSAPVDDCYGQAYRDYDDCNTSFPGWAVPGETCADDLIRSLDSCDEGV